MAKRKAPSSQKEAIGKTGENDPIRPITTIILADVALRAGGALLRRGVEQGILGQQVGKKKARRVVKARGMGSTLLATAAARIATRSVPGAIVVGGGMLAKTLYDLRRSRKAKQQAGDGSESE